MFVILRGILEHIFKSENAGRMFHRDKDGRYIRLTNKYTGVAVTLTDFARFTGTDIERFAFGRVNYHDGAEDKSLSAPYYCALRLWVVKRSFFSYRVRRDCVYVFPTVISRHQLDSNYQSIKTWEEKFISIELEKNIENPTLHNNIQKLLDKENGPSIQNKLKEFLDNYEYTSDSELASKEILP